MEPTPGPKKDDQHTETLLERAVRRELKRLSDGEAPQPQHPYQASEMRDVVQRRS